MCVKHFLKFTRSIIERWYKKYINYYSLNVLFLFFAQFLKIINHQEMRNWSQTRLDRSNTTIIVGNFKHRVQFRVDTIPSCIFALTIDTYMLRTRLKRGRKVTSSRYYSCSMPNNRFLSRFSQYVSISLAFQCLTDGRPFCSAFSFPLFSLSALSSARVSVFLSQNFHLFQFLSRSRTLLLSFILLFSRGYRKLSLHLSRTTFLLLY